jgi:rhamnose transport system ATP-binding protein
LLGENGAGKSAPIRIITCAYQADGGEFLVNGESVSHLSPGKARGLGVARIYQQPALFPDLSVAENVSLRLGKSEANAHNVMATALGGAVAE